MDASEGTDAGQDAAYLEGRRAAERREAADRNPHPAGSQEARRWAEGHASVTAPDAIADDLADFA